LEDEIQVGLWLQYWRVSGAARIVVRNCTFSEGPR
jgi:hypothetical protein